MGRPKKIRATKVGLHLSPEIRLALEARVSQSRGASACAALAVTRYAYLCERVRHGFDDDDVECFATVLDGLLPLDTPEISLIGKLIEFRARERAIELGGNLVAKLDVLGMPQRIALADAIERKRR